MRPDKIVIINMSGRGDKDVQEAARFLAADLQIPGSDDH